MKINKLTLLDEFIENGRRMCVCRCDCGNITKVEKYKFFHGIVKSCGCLAKIKGKEQGLKNRKYSQKDKDLYTRWRCIKHRCSTSSDKRDRYFDRGIKICDEWKNDFEEFKKWALSSGWDKNLTIERIDNNKGYNPENCCWVDRKKQARNRCSTRYVKYKGKNISVAELAEILQKPYRMIYTNIEIYGGRK